jgi:2-oxoglutarate/2-oxoacid ferredoxin oxidoreductase subunit beta
MITAEMNLEDIEKKTLKVIELSKEWGDRIPIGVFYQDERVSTYEDRIAKRISPYKRAYPAKQLLAGMDGKSAVDLEYLSKELLIS